MRHVFALLILTSTLAVADETPDLDAFLASLDTLTARFEQTVGIEGQADEQVSRGSLKILRPGRFRWDYESPTSQLVLSDGQRLWLYDPDLEQVTVRDMDGTLASTPAMLLGGEGDLDSHFKTGARYEEEGVSWVELVPLVQDSDFVGLRVGFCGAELCDMELLDKLGQYTRIHFEDVVIGEPLDPADFRFDPPEGVDVISESDF